MFLVRHVQYHIMHKPAVPAIQVHISAPTNAFLVLQLACTAHLLQSAQHVKRITLSSLYPRIAHQYAMHLV